MLNQIHFTTNNRGPYYWIYFLLLLLFTGRWAQWELKAVVYDSLLSALVMKLLCGMLLDLTVHHGE